MGHSGGTFIGIQGAALAPELYRAYIGVAQMSNQLESETRLLLPAPALQGRRQHEDGAEAERSTRHRLSPTTELVHLGTRFGNAPPRHWNTHDMKSVVTALLLRSLENREYTFSEKISMWHGKIFSGSQLWKTQLSTDLTTKVTRLQIPVYFFHCVYDYTVSYPLAKSDYERLDAPLKGFYTFTKSAHSPLFEEPRRMREIMQTDVLGGADGLADPE